MIQCPEWVSRRREVATEENYSCASDFQSTVESFPGLSNSSGISLSIGRLGLVGDIIAGNTRGFYYARTDHPNFAQLEERLKEIEVGRLSHPEYFSCKVFSSGMAAIKSTLEAMSLGQDGVFIHGDAMYPGTKELLANRGNGRNMVGTKAGIEVDLKETSRLEQELQDIQRRGDKVLGVIMEPVANLTTEYTDTRAVARIAHSYDVPVIVDNTFLTPYLLEPFRMGADVVIHSLTKYFSGEGDMIGGAVIMPKELERTVQEVRKQGGPIMSVRDAYEFAERVPLVGKRMQKHSQNAQILSRELREVNGIRVNYNDLAGQTRDGSAGGVLSFVFAGDNETAYQKARNFSQYVIEHPDIARQAVSLGEPRTLIVPWAGLVDITLLDSLNIPTGLVRVAVGRENNYSSVTAPLIREAVEASL